MVGPGTLASEVIHRLQGSFQPHRRHSITPSRYRLSVALRIGGWTRPQFVAPQIHGCIMGVQGIESQDEIISVTGDEHTNC